MHKMQTVNLLKNKHCLSFRTDSKLINARAESSSVKNRALPVRVLNRTETLRCCGAHTHHSGGTGLPQRSRGSSAPGPSIFPAGSEVSTAARCPQPSAGTSSSGCRCAACSTGRPSHSQSCCRVLNRGSDVNVHINHRELLSSVLSCTDSDRLCF